MSVFASVDACGPCADGVQRLKRATVAGSGVMHGCETPCKC